MSRLFDIAGTQQGWAWPFLLSAAVALFTVVLFRPLFAKLSKLEQEINLHTGKVTLKSKRELSIRISEVPAGTSLDTLSNNLKSTVVEDPALGEILDTLVVRSVIPIRTHIACATVTVRTSVHEDEVIRRLKEASKKVPYRYDCEFYDITPLYEDTKGAKVDVVAVPGLAGHAIGSWKSPSSNDIWLRDYLPADFPNIRVLLYGYDTTLLKNDSKQSIEDMGHSFLESLKAFRLSNNTHHRPIIFIGHSLGGLLVKEALVYARKKTADRTNSEVFKACCGLFFFGVPNLGLRNEQLKAIVGGQPNQNLIRDLLVDSDSEPSAFLKRISNDFSDHCKGHYRVVSFFERQHSSIVQRQADGTLRKNGPKMLMVTEKSATNTGLTAVPDEDNIAFNTDHSGLVKYDSSRQGCYPIVRGRLETLIREGVPRVTKQFQYNLTNEQRRLWNNLNNPPYSSFRNSGALSKPEEGTLNWLIQDSINLDGCDDNSSLQPDDFASWRDSSKSKCLLITAPPGSGKSVLSNFVLRHLEGKITENAKIIYYFCNIRNDVASRNATSILRALIIQLCETQQRLFQTLPSKISDDTSQFSSASLDTLLYYFEKMIRGDTYAQIYCVIDGLDVYHDGMDQLLSSLIRVFSAHGEVSGLTRKLFCTSRPNPRILDAWGRESPRRTLCCNPEDVKTFIHSRVASLNFSDDSKKMVVQLLSGRVEHTFIWIEVVLRKLKDLDFPSPNLVKDTIQNSSEDLYDLYTDLVQAATQKSRYNTRLLVWVVYAKRPLELDELAVGITLGPEDIYRSYDEMLTAKPSVTPEQIYRSLGTLLDIVAGKVYFIHQSAEDFFKQKQPLQGAFSHISPRLFPAYACMAYLNLIKTRNKSQLPFFAYASRFWQYHIQTANDIKDNIPLKKLVQRIVSPSPENTKLWSDCGYSLQHFDTNTHMIKWLVELFLDGGIDGLPHDFGIDDLPKLHYHILWSRGGIKLNGRKTTVELSRETAKYTGFP
ncbi:hypothetical protein F5B20DRAFT_567330 [Whalleya microplaca]|nr:hypothetical protein F5B20DRAFT_567330 [Whalleya microplaca]